MRYAVIDLPLEQLHSTAFRAAQIVRCAGEQGKYWEMRDQLFANPRGVEQIASQAATLALDASRFDACLSSGRFDADIRKDMSQAEAAGVTGTPSFLLATGAAAGGGLKPVRLITGAQPFANFKTQIDEVLKEQAGANK